MHSDVVMMLLGFAGVPAVIGLAELESVWKRHARASHRSMMRVITT
jgi:hypothetical protein